MKGERMRMNCERLRGAPCAWACSARCRRKQLEEGAGQAKRGRKAHVKASIAAYAERVRARAAPVEEAKRMARAVEWAGRFDAALMREADRRRARRGKEREVRREGFDGAPPEDVIIKDGHRAHVWNATTNRVAGMRARDPSWTDRMVRAATRFEHDYKVSTEGSLSGQFAQEHVDGGAASSGPNLAVLNASDSYRAALARLSEEEAVLLQAYLFKGKLIRDIAMALRVPYGAVSQDIKRALDALADHYGFPRSDTQRRRLALLREAGEG